jgi:hypothetical protein
MSSLSPKKRPTPEPPPEMMEAGTVGGSPIIRFGGALTVQDAFDADRLTQPLSRKLDVWASGIFLAIVAFGLLIVASYGYSADNLDLVFSAGLALLFVGLLASFFPGRAFARRRHASRQCQRGKGLFHVTAGRMNSEVIQTWTEEAGTTLKWSAFCGYRSSPSVAVLYLEFPRSFLVFARSKFTTDEDWRYFLTLVGTKLPQK